MPVKWVIISEPWYNPMDIENELQEARTQHRQGNIAAALPVYQAILDQQPDHPEALHLLGVASLQGGDNDKAVELIGRAVELEPDNTRMHNNLGSALLGLERVEEATERFRRSMELDPAFAEAPYNLGCALHLMHDPAGAETAYRRALEIAPQHRTAHNNLGAVLQSLGRFDEAVEEFREAVRLTPDSGECHANLVAVLELTNRMEEAERAAVDLMRVSPDNPVGRVLKARVEQRAGRLEPARELLDSVLAERQEPIIRHMALVEMSQLLDRAAAYPDAFRARTEAKQLRRSMPDADSWDTKSFGEFVRRCHAWFTPERMAPADEPSGEFLDRPVFYVGFPRSGTTLMEQVLGAHPGLVTTSEKSPLDRMTRNTGEAIGRTLELPEDLAGLTAAETGKLRQKFVDAAREIIGDDLARRRLVDKMPMNIVSAGIVNRLFPEARILVALRDPRDVCLSCYMQNFSANRAMLNFTEIESTGRFYARVMELWLRDREILTVPWLEYRYEDLVEDFAGTVRRVLAFIDVPWDDSVTGYAEYAKGRNIMTPSYSEVVKPVSAKAVGRWRNYQAELKPILPMLEPFVKAFGYDPS